MMQVWIWPGLRIRELCETFIELNEMMDLGFCVEEVTDEAVGRV